MIANPISTFYTASGHSFNILDIDQTDIRMSDIADGLSKQARFKGQYQGDFILSVAQHSVYVSILIRETMQQLGKYTQHEINRMSLIGLLHDGSEAYLGDMPTPVKIYLPDFAALEDKVQSAVYKQFGVEPTEMELSMMHYCDRRMFDMEALLIGRDPIYRYMAGDEECLDEIMTDYFPDHHWFTPHAARNVFLGMAQTCLFELVQSL